MAVYKADGIRSSIALPERGRVGVIECNNAVVCSIAIEIGNHLESWLGL